MSSVNRRLVNPTTGRSFTISKRFTNYKLLKAGLTDHSRYRTYTHSHIATAIQNVIFVILNLFQDLVV